MTRPTKQLLMEELAAHGYALAQPGRRTDPETVLERLVRQREQRLLEGFPVVLLHALREKAGLRWELPSWNPQHALGAAAAQQFVQLLALSYVLYRLFGLEEQVQERARKLLLKQAHGADTLRDVEARVVKAEPLELRGVRLSTDRAKHTFRTYAGTAPHAGDNPATTRALELELLLSELFTPRQKELVRKRATGAPMTNTEKTYFYRTVNKRLKALADEELHQLARRLVRR